MRKFLFISLCIVPVLLFAKYPLVRNYSRTMYKGGKQNWCIAQNKDNIMYFANNDGLLEFDSDTWQLYPISNYTNVRSILYDSTDGRLYAGAFNEFGYYLYDENTLKLKYFSLTDSIPLIERDFNEVWNISKDEKSVYFQCDRTIIRHTDGKITRFPFDHKIDKSAVIYNSLIIASSETGIWSLNGDMLFKFPNSGILTGKRVCAILPFTNRQILFVTAFDGVYIYNGVEVVPFKMDITEFLKENQVFCATIQNEKLAFGTVLKGLLIKDLKNNTNTYLNTYSGLQNNTILSIKFDRNDNLWLGLDKGIDYICINTPINNLFSSGNIYGSGYTSIVKNDILYLGTNQGLYTITYPIENNLIPDQLLLVPTMQGQVWCLTEIDNTLFCGNDQGAYIIEKGKATKIPGILGTWKFKELKKHPGYILACSYQGLYLLKKEYGKWKFSHYIKGFPEAGGLFDDDENGDIWFCHWMKGLFRLSLNERLDSVLNIGLYDHTKGLPTNENNNISKIKGKLFISSSNGFYKYSSDEDRIIPDEETNKLLGIYPTSVKLNESPEGDIWITSPSLICRMINHGNNQYTPDSTSYKRLLNKLNIGFEHFNFLDKNTVLAATEDGFSYLSTIPPKITRDSPHIFIRKVSETNSDSILYSRNEWKKGQTLIRKLSSNLNSLRFEYVLPEYQNEESIEYSYKLEGYDEKWSHHSTENSKEYTKLNPGNYTFQVKAQNKISGEISETSFHFAILPPWYLNTIAIICYFCIGILLIYLVGFFFDKRSKRAVKKIKQEKEMQMEEQKNMFLADAEQKEKEIIELKNQQLEYDLRHKSDELASSTMNLLRKNEILFEISNDIERLSHDLRKKEETLDCYRKLEAINANIKENIEHDNDWQKFAENFDMVYNNYLTRLSKDFPQLNTHDKRLCAYLKMGLSSKEIAPLLNLSVRSVETTRYRLRKKMELNREINLSDFLQRF